MTVEEENTALEMQLELRKERETLDTDRECVFWEIDRAENKIKKCDKKSEYRIIKFSGRLVMIDGKWVNEIKGIDYLCETHFDVKWRYVPTKVLIDDNRETFTFRRITKEGLMSVSKDHPLARET